MSNPNFDALLSTTLKKYTPKLEDNIFKELPLTFWLKQADHIEKIDGGEQIVEPLLYGENGTAESYAGYDSLDTTPQEGITAAQYDWRQFAVVVAIAGIEEAKNAGESKVLALLKSKIEQAELSAMDNMNAMFHADGTGNGGLDWNGLANIVDSAGIVGGIDRSTQAYWRSTETAVGGALTTGVMSTIYNTVSNGRGRAKPEFILTTQTLYEKYESLLQPQLRFQSSKVADAGFDNLLYKSAPVQWDTDCASGVMYFLNSRFLKLKVHKDVWFKNLPFERPHGQDAKYSPILSYGQLVTNNARHLGKLTGVTA